MKSTLRILVGVIILCITLSCFAACSLISPMLDKQNPDDEFSKQHSHEFVKKFDESLHFKECNCGAIIEAEAHTFGWVVDVEPTYTYLGYKHKKCVLCHYEEDKQEVIEKITFDDTTDGIGLEKGLKFNVPDDPSEVPPSPPARYCAYKSNKTEFDMDDVTLFFFFGGYYKSGVEYEIKHSSFPTFELYFGDDYGRKFLVKQIEENFVSQKYSCDVIYDQNHYITEIVFNHSEKITIPKEIFTEETGKIYFLISGKNEVQNNASEIIITSTYVFYKKVGEKVVLSTEPIE